MAQLRRRRRGWKPLGGVFPPIHDDTNHLIDVEYTSILICALTERFDGRDLTWEDGPLLGGRRLDGTDESLGLTMCEILLMLSSGNLCVSTRMLSMSDSRFKGEAAIFRKRVDGERIRYMRWARLVDPQADGWIARCSTLCGDALGAAPASTATAATRLDDHWRVLGDNLGQLRSRVLWLGHYVTHLARGWADASPPSPPPQGPPPPLPIVANATPVPSTTSTAIVSRPTPRYRFAWCKGVDVRTRVHLGKVIAQYTRHAERAARENAKRRSRGEKLFLATRWSHATRREVATIHNLWGGPAQVTRLVAAWKRGHPKWDKGFTHTGQAAGRARARLSGVGGGDGEAGT